MIENERVQRVYHISFDVSSLFTMVLLDYTVDLTLKRIYGDKNIETKISRKGKKIPLLLCTENVYLTFRI